MAVRPYGYCETAISSWGMVTSTLTLLCVGPESIETMYSVVFRVVKLLWLDQQTKGNNSAQQTRDTATKMYACV